MGEKTGNQQGRGWPELWTSETQHSTVQEQAPPPLISKKWLCHRLKIIFPSGSPNYVQLYTKVLTPDVLERLGCSIEEIRRRDFKTFNRVQTCALIRILEL